MYTTRIIAKNPSKKTGKAKLTIEVEFKEDDKKTRIYIPTTEVIKASNWKNGKLSKSEKDAAEKIDRVESKHNEIKQHLFDLKRKHGFVNSDILKAHLNRGNDSDKDILFLLDKFIELKKITAKPKLVEKLMAIRNHMEKFMDGENYYLHQFNQEFVNKLSHYWQEKKNLQPNTIHKNFKFIVQFLNHLKKEEVLTSAKYQHLDYPKEVETNTVVLSKEEVKKIINYSPEFSRHKKVKDLFLVLIFTGLRFSDAIRISKSWVHNDMLLIRTQKTDEKLSIPIHPILKELLLKYEYNLQALNISNQKFNKYVKELCELAKINDEVELVKYDGKVKKYINKQKWELIGSHTGRRTFITNAIVAGIPLPVIQKITGHKKLSTLQKYIDIADHIKSEEMNKLSAFYLEKQ